MNSTYVYFESRVRIGCRVRAASGHAAATAANTRSLRRLIDGPSTRNIGIVSQRSSPWNGVAGTRSATNRSGCEFERRPLPVRSGHQCGRCGYVRFNPKADIQDGWMYRCVTFLLHVDDDLYINASPFDPLNVLDRCPKPNVRFGSKADMRRSLAPRPLYPQKRTSGGGPRHVRFLP